MRLAPRSIAGRITLVLISGLFLTLVASIGVALIGGPFGDDHLRYPRLVGRVATVAAIAGSAPAERRPELLERVARPPLDAQWSPTAQPPAEAATGLAEPASVAGSSAGARRSWAGRNRDRR